MSASSLPNRYSRPSSSQTISSALSPDRRAVSSMLSRLRSRTAASLELPVASSIWSGSVRAFPQPRRNLVRAVDVSWSPEIVTWYEARRQAPCALVGDSPPDRAREQHGMAALAAVARRDDGVAARAPLANHPLDSLWREVRPVREDDDSGLRFRRQRREAAAQRRAGPLRPFGTADDARVGLDVVRAEHDHDVVDGGAMHPLEHLREEEPLLRRAEARRRPGG